MTNVINVATTTDFFAAAAIDIAAVAAKETQISRLRVELDPESNKIMAIALLAVVAKGLRLELGAFKGRKTVAGQFRDSIKSCGVKGAKAKMLAENAIKFARHETFKETVAAAEDVGGYSQAILAVFAEHEIVTQSALILLLNPREELPLAVQLAIAALKAAGVPTSEINITDTAVWSETELDEDAARILTDALGYLRSGSNPVARKTGASKTGASKTVVLENAEV